MWAKVDDGFPDHDKVADAGARLARAHRRDCAAGATGVGRVIAVWLSLTCFSNRFLTDGFISSSVAGSLKCDHRPLDVLRAMQDRSRGLARTVKGGWRLLGYHKYQPSKKNVEKTRQKARARMRKLRGGRSRSVRANKLAVRELFATPVPSRPHIDQDQDPRLSARALEPDCAKPVQHAEPADRALAALAFAVLVEDPNRYVADVVDWSEEVKTRAARAGLVYDGASVGQAIREAEARHERERFGKRAAS